VGQLCYLEGGGWRRGYDGAGADAGAAVVAGVVGAAAAAAAAAALALGAGHQKRAGQPAPRVRKMEVCELLRVKCEEAARRILKCWDGGMLECWLLVAPVKNHPTRHT